MTTPDRLFTAAEGHFAASKNRDYRARTIMTFDSIIFYLQNNGLTTRTILAPGQSTDVNTRIMLSDLTEVGLALMRACYDKWLKGHDRGKPITEMTIFEKELKKLKG